ncbi:Sec-independent protein translocase subunit TatA [Kitasatospora sp. NPDC058184]|uniref:Sec-independent protein translocase subunit TatA n=1 Tax=Kitasatospora sp. NPDC058184 TaxID=3346370 RepID=UPI0036D81BE9
MLRNGLEPWHVLVTVAVLVLLFGSKKLPEMARGLGKSMRILKSETAALREDGAPGGAVTEPPGGATAGSPGGATAGSPGGATPGAPGGAVTEPPAVPQAGPVKRPL